MTSPVIMPATRADLDDLAAMVNGAYRGETARRGWTHEADLLGGQRTDPASLADELDAPDPSTVLLLREAADGPILGCVMTQRFRDEAERPLCHLAMLTVHPERQGQGFGALLIGEVERRARAAGCVAVEMTVLHGRAELLAFYQRRGYAPTGRIKPFPYGETRFGLPHRDDLHFLVLEKPL
ncbi:GNAT family N-acetyltransferase [Lichenibacterium ramalinae]|uniref:GNAT family N-acetyltransferase n=1 Tax=Lichenibacterium ramalinae TaxID=2316527 RepID=A0A4Q2RDU4_9HYPH|nr:GNAT family N-acetyltransferase [Lichenibacterium ramalinae]RYB05622.1 GNAT family N-acetyltransferase [Lichenibacterium ramalinae]